MTAEWLTAIATLGTFVVIAASAAAALLQIRHMRNGNQLSVFSEFRHHLESEEFRAAFRFAVTEFPQRADDPQFRRDLLTGDSQPWLEMRELLNYLDYTGALVKNRMVDRTLACDLFYFQVVRTWESLAPLISTQRARTGYRTWEDFEYLYLECLRFRKRYPDGTFPQAYGAAPLPPPWPEAASAEPEAVK